MLARRQLAKSLEGQRIAELEHTIAGQAERIAELEGIVRDVAKMLAQDGKCLTALGAPPVGLNYGGVWSPERDYPSLVTDKGALHVATEMTIKGERPGSGGPWQERVDGHLSVPDDDRPKNAPMPALWSQDVLYTDTKGQLRSPAHGARSMPWRSARDPQRCRRAQLMPWSPRHDLSLAELRRRFDERTAHLSPHIGAWTVVSVVPRIGTTAMRTSAGSRYIGAIAGRSAGRHGALAPRRTIHGRQCGAGWTWPRSPS